MTATSAWGASERPQLANPFPERTVAPPEECAHVRIPGSDRTYEVRDVLRGMGLRWDPVSHAWHGTLPLADGSRLAREFGLRPQIVPTIEAFEQVTLRRPVPTPRRPLARPGVPPRVHDGRATHVEARLAFRGADPVEDETSGLPGRRFSVFETTSGLPDDSREADERNAARRLRELRSRVKAARAAISAAPGSGALLRADWVKAAWFYSRFGITEAMFRHGVASTPENPSDSRTGECRDLPGPGGEEGTPRSRPAGAVIPEWGQGGGRFFTRTCAGA
jgi:hypothetical protein